MKIVAPYHANPYKMVMKIVAPYHVNPYKMVMKIVAPYHANPYKMANSNGRHNRKKSPCSSLNK